MARGTVGHPVESPFRQSLLNGELGAWLSAMGVGYGTLYLKSAGENPPQLVPLLRHGLPSGVEGYLIERAVLKGHSVLLAETPHGLSQDSSGGCHAVVGVPVEVSGRVAGALILGFWEGLEGVVGFGREPLACLVAQLVGAGLTCDELHSALAEQEAGQAQMARSTLLAQEAERERVCLEVHDGPAQSMVSVLHLLQQACESNPSAEGPESRDLVRQAVTQVEEAIRQAREVINSALPAPLEELGFAGAIRLELKQIRRETGCRVEFRAPKARLPVEMEHALYRIVHEALSNVRRHANSRRLRVELKRGGDILTVRVKDWGAGFDPAIVQQAHRRRSGGLLSMRLRAELLKGSFQIITAPNQGTEVVVRVPLPATVLGVEA